jgi:hypothetical protein
MNLERKNLSAVCAASNSGKTCLPGSGGGHPPGQRKEPSFFSKTVPGAYADLEIREGKGTGNTRKRLHRTMLNSIEIRSVVMLTCYAFTLSSRFAMGATLTGFEPVLPP